MANFSRNERIIASFLSATPRLKRCIKSLYIQINSVIYKKRYTQRILSDKILEIKNPLLKYQWESFGGYYDKYTINRNGIILINLTDNNTKISPRKDKPIRLIALNIHNGNIQEIGHSYSYNWQQGCRAHWLTDDQIIYNDFRDNKYVAIVYSLTLKRKIKEFAFPVQDSYKTDYFLSINYRRIMTLRPDYGYRNLPTLQLNEMNNLSDDGIWQVDYNSGKFSLLHSLQDIIDCDYQDIFTKCLHKVNHIMINKTGDGFIFIHRFYYKGQRFDRLIYSDFKSLKVIVNDKMVSHCCWIDKNTLLGYFRYQNKNGYYYCDIHTNNIVSCLPMTNLGVGDGHPSCYNDWIAFDSYPDKSRMQHLYLFNKKSGKIFPLLELYQNTHFSGECRCDLHPRFSEDGKYISFDSVFSGKRAQYYIYIGDIVKK